MEYFLIANSTDKKETGLVGPQCMVFPNGYNLDWYDEPNSMTNLTNDAFPDFEPNLIFELDKKAKLTDFISQVIIHARGFLINQKVKKIFEQFNLGQHKFYPATVIYKNEKYQYFWLHLINNSYDDIDFKNSVFYEGLTFNYKVSDISINSFDELLSYRENELKLIYAEKIIFRNKYKNLHPNIYLYSLLHHDVIISSNIYNELKNNNISGYKTSKTSLFEN